MKVTEMMIENVKTLGVMVEMYKTAEAEDKNAIANAIVDTLPEIMPSEKMAGADVAELVAIAHQNIVARDRIISIIVASVECAERKAS